MQELSHDPSFEQQVAHPNADAHESRFVLGALSERGCARWPEHTALIDRTARLTFRQLHAAVDALASALVTRGVRPRDQVALLGTKDRASVIALLAIARAGAVYVPLDPNLPRPRLRFVLDDCEPALVLGQERLGALAEGARFAALSEDGSIGESADHAELPAVAPEDLAYLMYTSGSTGQPKGVLIEHRNVHAFFLAHNARAGIAAGDCCLNTGPFHFDVSVMDVLLPLFFGATVVLSPELPMPKLLLSLIERHRITHLYAVGSVLAMITGNGRWLGQYDLSSLRMLQTGAEVCNPRVVNEWLARIPELRFLNSYGPTELTVGCTSYLQPKTGLLPMAEVPIGELHEGSCACIVDEAGVVIDATAAEGELLVGGAQLMRGYHRRPAEEARAFVIIDGVRYYRTGDIVRRDPEGRFHYRGRRDDETKIDGHRVHLSEVKRCLEAHPFVASAAVGLVPVRRGKRRVGAAVVLHDGTPRELAGRLLAWVAGELPNAFVPAGLLICRELPRTSTGKADGARLMSELARRLTEETDKVFVSRTSERLSEPADIAVEVAE